MIAFMSTMMILAMNLGGASSFQLKKPVQAVFTKPIISRSLCSSTTHPGANDDDAAAAAAPCKVPLIGTQRSGVTFLGKGSEAVVRLGSVLIAPEHEYHHFYRQAAIFVYDMGENDNREYVVRGLILDHPTPFTLGEMMPSVDPNNPLSQRLLFRGGDKGKDGVILLHRQSDLEGQSTEVADGIYQGGWDAALAACAAHTTDPVDFKVFFNYCEFTEAQLDGMMKGGEGEEEDAWTSVTVPVDMILSSEWDRGGAWARLRNAVAQMAMTG